MKYSFDTSAILDGWVKYYPPDVFPTVWQSIDSLAASGHLVATVEVLNELEKKEDEVYEWLKNRPHMVVPVDGQIQVEVSQILTAHPRLVNTQKNRSQADPWVIALARVENGVVVSGELRSYNLDRPKVPDVCDALGVPHMRLVDMFRQQGWSL